MFIQSCFIRKNTKELKEELKNIGYKFRCRTIIDEKWNSLYCVNGLCFDCNDIPDRYHSIIDCCANDELFLAIAALRDDTDKHQWFVHKSKSHWWFCTDFDLFKEDYESSNEDTELKFEDWHKASVEELIEHFKDI